MIPGIGPAMFFYDKLTEKIPRKVRRRVPFLQENISVVKHWEWAQGFHRIGKNQLYVNRGLGTYLPGRLFCRPEVTIITLQGE
jgi:predicted MPP superfamily phosphohydrolase